jgi:phasin
MSFGRTRLPSIAVGAAGSKRPNTGESIMTDDGRDPFAIPQDMRNMAEASFEQARKAFDKFMESARSTAGSIEERRETVRAGAKEIGNKAVANAEKNVQAALNYAQSLLKARDLSEVMRLHSDYVQSQMRALAEQTSEMGQIVGRAAMDAAKPKP